MLNELEENEMSTKEPERKIKLYCLLPGWGYNLYSTFTNKIIEEDKDIYAFICPSL